jgi:excisionase family DNA binding protein
MKGREPTLTTPKFSLTVLDAAKASGFSENFMRVLIVRGDLPHIRVGRAVRVLVADLENFLRDHRHRGTVILSKGRVL